MQLQGQRASDWGWRAAKGARAWSAGGAPCLRALDAAEEGSELVLLRGFATESPSGSPQSLPDATSQAGLRRLRVCAAPKGFPSLSGNVLFLSSSQAKVHVIFTKLCFLLFRMFSDR